MAWEGQNAPTTARDRREGASPSATQPERARQALAGGGRGAEAERTAYRAPIPKIPRKQRELQPEQSRERQQHERSREQQRPRPEPNEDSSSSSSDNSDSGGDVPPPVLPPMVDLVADGDLTVCAELCHSSALTEVGPVDDVMPTRLHDCHDRPGDGLKAAAAEGRTLLDEALKARDLGLQLKADLRTCRRAYLRAVTAYNTAKDRAMPGDAEDSARQVPLAIAVNTESTALRTALDSARSHAQRTRELAADVAACADDLTVALGSAATVISRPPPNAVDADPREGPAATASSTTNPTTPRPTSLEAPTLHTSSLTPALHTSSSAPQREPSQREVQAHDDLWHQAEPPDWHTFLSAARVALPLLATRYSHSLAGYAEYLLERGERCAEDRLRDLDPTV